MKLDVRTKIGHDIAYALREPDLPGVLAMHFTGIYTNRLRYAVGILYPSRKRHLTRRDVSNFLIVLERADTSVDWHSYLIHTIDGLRGLKKIGCLIASEEIDLLVAAAYEIMNYVGWRGPAPVKYRSRDLNAVKYALDKLVYYGEGR